MGIYDDILKGSDPNLKVIQIDERLHGMQLSVFDLDLGVPYKPPDYFVRSFTAHEVTMKLFGVKRYDTMLLSRVQNFLDDVPWSKKVMASRGTVTEWVEYGDGLIRPKDVDLVRFRLWVEEEEHSREFIEKAQNIRNDMESELSSDRAVEASKLLAHAMVGATESGWRCRCGYNNNSHAQVCAECFDCRDRCKIGDV